MLVASLEVRALRPLERAAVERLGSALFAPYGDYAAALHDWLRSPSVRTVVVADQGSPVGFAMVSSVQGKGYLLGIGVADGYRRVGLGKRLLEAALEQARSKRKRWGISWVDLDVAEDNTAAVALFEGAGFFRLKTGAERYKGGQAVVTMRRRLV